MKKNLQRLFLGFILVVSCLAGANFRTHAGKQNEKSFDELADLTVRLVDLSARLEKEDGFSRGEFERLASARFARLGELAESSPADVLRFALPPDVLARLPAGEESNFEKRIDEEGEIEVIYECNDENVTLKYFLKTAKEHLPIYFTKAPEAEIRTGSKVRLKGVRVDNALVADDANRTENLEIVESIAANTFGEQKVLVLLVNFRDDTSQPNTVQQANDLVFGSVNNFYREASYGQTWVTGNAYGWFTLPINTGDCTGTQTASAAKQAAQNAGINLSDYTKFVYVYPYMAACNYGGRGTIGGNEVWINGSLYHRTVAHEMGHNFGLYHGRSKDCGTEVIGGSCTTNEYGNIVDTMGYPGVTGEFDVYQKERLGWVGYGSSPPLLTVQTSGNYFISPNSVQDNSPKGLKILKSNGTWYHVEVRRPIGFDSFVSTNSNVMNGVIVTLNSATNGQENYLLDMTPENTYMTDAALTVGRSYTDTSAGFTITPLTVDNTGATVNVSFGSAPPPPTCTLNNPTVAASPTATQWIGAGSAVTYSVTVTNNNSSGCAANTFNLQAAIPAGWSASSASSLSVSPGTSAVANVQVLSPNSAANGFYSVSLGAMNSVNASYGSNVAANLSVYNSLAVSAAADRTSYTNAQTVYLTANVAANGSPLAGANVAFTVKRPDGTVAVSGTAVSNSSGIALLTYKFNRKKDMAGTFQVSANASLSGVSGAGSTSFVLLK